HSESTVSLHRTPPQRKANAAIDNRSDDLRRRRADQLRVASRPRRWRRDSDRHAGGSRHLSQATRIPAARGYRLDCNLKARAPRKSDRGLGHLSAQPALFVERVALEMTPTVAAPFASTLVELGR